MNAASSGLGRGLAAIFTGPDAASGDDSLRSRLIESALSSLSDGRSLGLCGYLHDHDGDVSVTLRSPKLHSLHPTEGYHLFTSLAALKSRCNGRHEFRVGDREAWAVTSVFGETRGVLFFGDSAITDVDAARLADFCEVYMPVILGHDRPSSEAERLHLVLDQEGGAVHAKVSVGGAVGFGSASRSHLAAARAALSTRCVDAKLVDVGSVVASDGAASFVVAAGDMGTLGMGAAPVVEGHDAAAAVAALRASDALGCAPPAVGVNESQLA